MAPQMHRPQDISLQKNPDNTMTKTIGKSIRRVDARGKVIGETLYSGDITMPNMAYMKILFARRPHALIKSIDTSAAEATKGVIAVFTAKDVPVNEYGLQIADQPVLCDEVVRFVGDQVALVIAESEEKPLPCFILVYRMLVKT